MIHPEDTIVALSTPPGAGARAIVRLSGPAALSCVLGIFCAAEPVDLRQRRFYSGFVRLPELKSSLPADLHVWPGPRSYTGQDVVELHTLSSVPLIQLLIAQLLNAGARAAQPGEFTMRAFLAGKLDLTRAEAVLGVIEAGDRTELRHALAQLAGGVTRPLEGLREDMLNLLADVEAGLDFSDEDIRFVDQAELLGRIAKGLAQLTLLHKQLGQRGVGRKHFRVVLVGRPNAGKSSLFNTLAPEGEALVSPEPGTTRDYLAGTLELEGVSVELIDTAGWQADAAGIEAQAQVLTSKQFADADLVVLCLDSALPATEQEKALLSSIGPQVLAVATKCDLQPAPPRLLATSATTGMGLDRLRGLLAERARSHREPPLAPSVSRCRHHVDVCINHLRNAHSIVLNEDPPELLAVELRGTLDSLGGMVGAVYTDDLLDRVFSRFCIGK